MSAQNGPGRADSGEHEAQVMQGVYGRAEAGFGGGV